MTREAKIGMLTGLGVIVLIGVLLSEYLGGSAGTGSSTGRMANVPLGESYRQDVMKPVGVPGSERVDGGGGVAPVAMGGGVAAVNVLPVMPVAPGMTDVPTAYAAVDTKDGSAIEGGPVIGQPVAAVPAGELQQQVAVGDAGIPTLNLNDGKNGGAGTVYVAGQAPVAVAGGAVAPGGNLVVGDVAAKGEVYVIVSGDSLPKIAKKFYKSAKDSDVARIVGANGTVLPKGAKTVLMVGKKLFIPSVVKAGVVAVAKAPDAGKSGTVVVGPAVAKTGGGTGADGATKNVVTVYVVQKGDTLGKIAHEMYPGSAVAMSKKIIAMNGMKNADDIQVGEKLKMPAKG